MAMSDKRNHSSPCTNDSKLAGPPFCPDSAQRIVSHQERRTGWWVWSCATHTTATLSNTSSSYFRQSLSLPLSGPANLQKLIEISISLVLKLDIVGEAIRANRPRPVFQHSRLIPRNNHVIMSIVLYRHSYTMEKGEGEKKFDTHKDWVMMKWRSLLSCTPTRINVSGDMCILSNRAISLFSPLPS